MAPNTHPVSILAGLQVSGVIGGTFAVRLMTTGHEASGSGLNWGATSLFLRDFGWLLLGVPAIWTIGSLALERRPRGFWNGWWTIATGLLLFVAMGFIFMTSMGNFSIR